MEYAVTIISVACAILVTAILTYFFTNKKVKKQINEYKSHKDALSDLKDKISVKENELSVANEKYLNTNNTLLKTKEELNNSLSELKKSKDQYDLLNKKTKELQQLRNRASHFETVVSNKQEELKKAESLIREKQIEIISLDKRLHEIMSEIDLYSRIDELVEYGYFEMPEYLYETSARFTEEIKQVRNKQKELIKNDKAVIYPDNIKITGIDKKILNGQKKLMLNTFNIECDFLIGKINPGNYARTIEKIEKIAASIESSAASLHVGFNINYVKFKFEECTLQYQYKLKKQEEQEEQRLLREQMREEQKAIREYERAISQAEEEQQIYRDLLEKAQQQLNIATEDEKQFAQQRIAELENLLAVAEAKGERAKSMAEQTKRGHVYPNVA